MSNSDSKIVGLRPKYTFTDEFQDLDIEAVLTLNEREHKADLIYYFELKKQKEKEMSKSGRYSVDKIYYELFKAMKEELNDVDSPKPDVEDNGFDDNYTDLTAYFDELVDGMHDAGYDVWIDVIGDIILELYLEIDKKDIVLGRLMNAKIRLDRKNTPFGTSPETAHERYSTENELLDIKHRITKKRLERSDIHYIIRDLQNIQHGLIARRGDLYYNAIMDIATDAEERL